MNEELEGKGNDDGWSEDSEFLPNRTEFAFGPTFTEKRKLKILIVGKLNSSVSELGEFAFSAINSSTSEKKLFLKVYIEGNKR